MKIVGSSKVVLYSLNYSARLLTEIPYVRYSSERSLCHLAELRRDDTHLTVVTSAPVDPYILEYHYRDLFRFDAEQLRSANDRLTLLSPRSEESRPLDSLVVADHDMMHSLKEAAQLGREVVVANFSASQQAEEVALLLGASLEEPGFVSAARWGSKAGGKDLLIRSAVPVPSGDAGLYKDEASVLAAVRRLATGDRPAERAMVKLNDPSWAGAIGNVVVDCERAVRAGDLKQSLELIRQPWPDFIQELTRYGVIVEEFVPDVVSSPSGIGSVAPDGTVRVLANHDQILSNGQYWGCRFPAAEQWRSTIVQAVERVGHTLADIGVSGSFGIDFVASASGELFGVEVNLRKVGPSHVLNYVESLIGAPVDGSASMPLHYLNRRLHRPDVLAGEQPREVVERLRGAGLLFDPQTRTGVALHVLGALAACGYVEITSVAGSAEMTDALSAAAETVILNGRG